VTPNALKTCLIEVCLLFVDTVYFYSSK